MNLLAPVIPSLVIGVLVYLLRGKLPWYSAVVLAFFITLGVQLYSLLSLSLGALEPQVLLNTLLTPMVLTSLYFSLLTAVFSLVALGVNVYLKKHVENDLVRYVVSVYIALLLFQLWVEVFPWTLELPLRLYSG